MVKPFKVIEISEGEVSDISEYATLDEAKAYLRACRAESRDAYGAYRAELWQVGAAECTAWIANGAWARQHPEQV